MVNHDLTIRYDPEADAAYIYLVPPGPDRSVARSSVAGVRMDRAAITIDFTSDDLIAGIEILGASRVLPLDLLGGATGSEPD
ncbi:MAG: DUF2283 domain-containing protein [Nocardioides sp.]